MYELLFRSGGLCHSTTSHDIMTDALALRSRELQLCTFSFLVFVEVRLQVVCWGNRVKMKIVNRPSHDSDL